MNRKITLLFTTLLLMCVNAQFALAQGNTPPLLAGSTAVGTVTPENIDVATRTGSPVKAEISITNTGTVKFNTTIAFFSDYGYFIFAD